MSRSDGPDSVVRRVNSEVVVLLGWGRAVLLQLAHPLVAAGVADHSDYGAGLFQYLQRTRGTVGSMLSLTFGSSAAVHATADRINAIHRRVHGQLSDETSRFPRGTRYTATDPELLRWVHATLVQTQLLTYELLVEPLSSGLKTRYVEESADVAPLLSIPERFLPTSCRALDRYLDARYADDTIEVTETARTLARQLLFPPGGQVTAPLLALGRLVTAGLLPPAIREQYGLPWDTRRERRFRRLIRVIRRIRGVLPAIAREWPAARSTRPALLRGQCPIRWDASFIRRMPQK